MKRLRCGLVAMLAAGLSFAGDAFASEDSAVAYKVSPVIQNGVLKGLDVEFRLHGDASGVTMLDLPDHTGSGRNLWRNLRGLTVQGATRVTQPDDVHRRVEAPANAPLTIRYHVVAGIDHQPNQDDRQPFEPWIRPTWFYAVGEAVFVHPHNRDAAPASFVWGGPSSGFVFVSDLEKLTGRRRAAGPEGTVSDVLESVMLGGTDVTVVIREDHGARIRIASRGSYLFGETQIADVAQKIIGAERDFWGDQGSPFLITVAPLVSEGGSSMSGRGRKDAFLIALTPDISLAQLKYLLAHEYFHTWNPGSLGSPSEGPDQVLDYWFSEGFTDFYARRLLRRNGITTPQDFADEWNEMLLSYALSPVRAEPNTRIKSDFWKDDAAEKLPYQRGAMLAAIWNARLRSISGGRTSLDDMLRAQRALVRSGKGNGKSPAALFSEVAAQFGLDVRGDIARYINQGEVITLPADVFGTCMSVSTVTQSSFDRGYDPEATAKAGNSIAGLRSNSPAFEAGLRNGMKILRREAGSPGDSSVIYSLRVIDNGQERTISFRPVGRGDVTFQRLMPQPDAKRQAPAKCS